MISRADRLMQNNKGGEGLRISQWDHQFSKIAIYNLFVTSKKRNHKFTNLKCCKMSFKAFKMKKQDLKCF